MLVRTQSNVFCYLLLVISLVVGFLTFSSRAESIDNKICIAAAVAVGVCATLYSYFSGQSSPYSDATQRALSEGTFGYPYDTSFDTLQEGTLLFRGDGASGVLPDTIFMDPLNQGSGIILSQAAYSYLEMKGVEKNFDNAVIASQETFNFIQSLLPEQRQFLVDAHLADKNPEALKNVGGSPFLSTTLSPQLAAVFATALGKGKTQGNVYSAIINNASLYPLVTYDRQNNGPFDNIIPLIGDYKVYVSETLVIGGMLFTNMTNAKNAFLADPDIYNISIKDIYDEPNFQKIVNIKSESLKDRTINLLGNSLHSVTSGLYNINPSDFFSTKKRSYFTRIWCHARGC